MKKILVLTAMLFSSLFLSAQDAETIFKTIENGSARKGDFVVKFAECRMFPGKDKVDLTGDLVFKPDTFLSMIYTNKEKFIIDGNKMVIIRDGQNQVLDLTKNIMMRGLSHALLYSFQGKLPLLAKEQSIDITAAKDGKDYVVTLIAKKKMVKGISRLTVKYNQVTGAIKDMLMEEFGGNRTYYKVL